MPKKGKRNLEEKEDELRPEFKKLKNKHSAVESNINELEQCGLDRCPDRGYEHFKSYIAAGVTSYNLQKIGKQIIKIELAKQKKAEKRKLKRAS